MVTQSFETYNDKYYPEILNAAKDLVDLKVAVYKHD